MLKKMKRALALGAVAAIALLFMVTLILAFIDTEKARELLMASIVRRGQAHRRGGNRHPRQHDCRRSRRTRSRLCAALLVRQGPGEHGGLPD